MSEALAALFIILAGIVFLVVLVPVALVIGAWLGFVTAAGL